jgi:hypothetical protein
MGAIPLVLKQWILAINRGFDTRGLNPSGFYNSQNRFHREGAKNAKNAKKKQQENFPFAFFAPSR